MNPVFRCIRYSGARYLDGFSIFKAIKTIKRDIVSLTVKLGYYFISSIYIYQHIEQVIVKTGPAKKYQKLEIYLLD